MSSNTNTLFWVITGAVVVLGVFLLVSGAKEGAVTNASNKFSTAFSDKLSQAEKEALNNPVNIKKYYGYRDEWESIVVEDTELFEFDENTGTILAYNGTSSTITIPYQINGVKVKKIGPIGMKLHNQLNDYNYSCTEDCVEPVQIENVILPNTIEELGDYSFYYTENLKSINLPNSIKKIGNQAFFSSNIINVNFKDLTNLTHIGDYAFNNANISGDIEFADSLIYLGHYSFGGNNISNVVLSKNLEKLQDLTFFANTNLKSVTFRGSNTNVNSKNLFYSYAKPTIYVPKGSLSWYKSFSYLSKYNMVEVNIDE